MKLTSVAVLVCLLFTKTDSLCVDTFTTVCDNLADVKTYGNTNWLSLTIGSAENDPDPKQTLESAVFHKCTNLEELTIIGAVNNLNSSALMPLRKLVVLNFYKNSIKTLSDFTFVAVPTLSRLNLQNNEIEELTSEGPFINSTLKTVNLSHNNLRRLSVDTFKIAGLNMLIITHNKISEITPSNIFSSDLQYLNMDHNLLYHISAEVFKDMDNLEDLILSNNEFTVLRIKFQLKRLRTLDLSHNRINIIEPDVFDGMPNLMKLYLNHNLIRQLPVTTFELNLKHLKIWALFLHNNRIENLEFLVKNRWPALKALTIAENPLPCDCLNLFLTFMELTGLELSPCDTSYFRSGTFPVCISIHSYWEDGKCIQSQSGQPAGDAYDVFLSTPKDYIYKCY